MRQRGLIEEISEAVTMPLTIANFVEEKGVSAPIFSGFVSKANSTVKPLVVTDSAEENGLCCNNLLAEHSSLMGSACNKQCNQEQMQPERLQIESENQNCLMSNDMVDHGSSEEGFPGVNMCSQSVLSENSSSSGEYFIASEFNSMPSSDTEKHAHDSQSIVNQTSLLVGLEPVGDVVLVDEVLDVEIANGLDRDLPLMLFEASQERINRTMNGQVISDMDSVALWGITSICGRRPEMEDAVAVVPCFQRLPIRILTGDCERDGISQSQVAHFFGVYDGHGGCQVANYCGDRLHLALVEEIEMVKEDFQTRSSGKDWSVLWENVLSRTFQKVDAEVSGVNHFEVGQEHMGCKENLEPIAPETVGSTAVVAVVCSTHIIVANCGDSRAVLYRGKASMALSMDHKPERADERERIEGAGGRVIQWNGYRVFGVLAMSRSIGDRFLKPWIIPDPEVMLLPRAKDDDFLILATDGLWDVMTNNEACEAARRRILLWHKKHGPNISPSRGKDVDPAAQAAAEYLCKLALQRGSKDNITVIVVDLKPHRKVKIKS